jgi:hypothetical protein
VGTYYDTLQNISGCDSIIELTLTVLPKTYFTDIHNVCDSLQWLDGITYYANNNIAQHIIPNTEGCDSLITLDLTIRHTTYFTDIQNVCDSLQWLDGITYYANNNIAQHIIPNATGCDSIITLNLTVNLTHFTQISDSIYAGSSYNFAGKILTATGIYYDTLSNVNGCDSIVCLTLTVNIIPVDSIIDIPATAIANTPLTLTGTVVPSNATNQTITWSLVNPGTTNASVYGNNTFFASSEGVAVVCASIKDGKSIGEDYEQCFTIMVSNVGIVEGKHADLPLQVYPNPAGNQLIIIGVGADNDSPVQIFNVVGQCVGAYPCGRPETGAGASPARTIDVSHLAAGMYFLKCRDAINRVCTVKFVKE